MDGFVSISRRHVRTNVMLLTREPAAAVVAGKICFPLTTVTNFWSDTSNSPIPNQWMDGGGFWSTSDREIILNKKLPNIPRSIELLYGIELRGGMCVWYIYTYLTIWMDILTQSFVSLSKQLSMTLIIIIMKTPIFIVIIHGMTVVCPKPIDRGLGAPTQRINWTRSLFQGVEHTGGPVRGRVTPWTPKNWNWQVFLHKLCRQTAQSPRCVV